jgi:hypothetical protein
VGCGQPGERARGSSLESVPVPGSWELGVAQSTAAEPVPSSLFSVLRTRSAGTRLSRPMTKGLSLSIALVTKDQGHRTAEARSRDTRHDLRPDPSHSTSKPGADLADLGL